MDLVALTHAIATTLAPALPYLFKAGAKAGEEASKKIGADAWEWTKDLWRRLSPKVESKPTALLAAQDVASSPNDADAQAILAAHLKKLLSEDPELAAEAEDWFEKAKAAGVIAIASGERSVAVGRDVRDSNIITGEVKEATVVTGRDAHDIVGRDQITQTIYQAAATPAATALHQLRAPVGDFVGREQEIETLINALRGGGRAGITGISGMGGIGKTELALLVAEQLAAEYADAQFFINLLGTGPQPRRPDELLPVLIRAFVGPEAILPEDLDQLERIYRSQLSGKRVLILLDDAADAEQVRPLLPPTSCAAMITSRQIISLPAMTPVTLNPLSGADARKLLLEISPRAEPVADEICQLCGYLPLAIRAAGSLLATTADLDADEYLARLQEERSRLQVIGSEGVELGVEACLNLSYSGLDSETARVFRELAIFPATFDSVAEESICLDAEHTRLTDLVRRSLVFYDASTKRYRLHDLVRLLATVRLGERSRIISERHSSYYVKVLEKAGDLYQEGSAAMDRGLALFDLELANISAGQAWAAAHSRQNSNAASLCIDYVDLGSYVLKLRQNPLQQMSWVKSALATARRSGKRDAQFRLLNDLARCHSHLGKKQRAVLSYKKALEIADAANDRHWRAVVISNLADVYLSLGSIDIALEHLKESCAIFRSLGDRRNEGFALGSLASCYKDIGEINRALNLYEKQLTIAQGIGDRYQEASTLCQLGYLACRRCEYSKAIELNNQALRIARAIGDRADESDALNGLGYAHMELGDSERAIEFYEKALHIARVNGSRSGEASFLNSIGAAYLYLGDYCRAIEFFDQSLGVCRELSDPGREVCALLNLGLVYEKLGEGTKVKESYERALRIAREIGDVGSESTALSGLGSELARLGDHKRAVGLKEQALALIRQVGDDREEGSLLFDLSILLNRLGQRSRAIACAKESLRIRERIQDPRAAKVRSRLAAWGEDFL